jgi:hypothetical protein
MKSGGGTAGSSNPVKPNGHAVATDSNPPYRKGLTHKLRPPVPILDAEASAVMRDKLAAGIAGLGSVDIAVEWARGSIAAKNTLTAADASAIETAFRDRMQVLESGPEGSKRRRSRPSAELKAGRIDKSALTIPEPPRYRNKEHLRVVAQQACLVCGRKPSDPHHLRFMQPRALGRKVSDEFVVPLCRIHHREAHRAGDERAWWKQVGIDPIKAARRFWRITRMNESLLRTELEKKSKLLEAPPRPDAAFGDASA